MERYLAQLSEYMFQLPSEFQQCSITGGEPTTLSWLPEILDTIRWRFKKIVLSTNGFNMTEEIIRKVDHINISRHHYGDTENFEKFGTNTVPNHNQLRSIAAMAEVHAKDVTLNCVLPTNFDDEEFINRYITFAKVSNVNAVCFRKEHSDLHLIPVEAKLTSKILEDGRCPACRKRVRTIRGMTTTWRYSVKEPSDVLTGVYELIMQPNGDLTSDWAGKKIVKPKPPFTMIHASQARASAVVDTGGDCNMPSHHGCGGGGSSCGMTMTSCELPPASCGHVPSSCGSYTSCG